MKIKIQSEIRSTVETEIEIQFPFYAKAYGNSFFYYKNETECLAVYTSNHIEISETKRMLKAWREEQQPATRAEFEIARHETLNNIRRFMSSEPVHVIAEAHDGLIVKAYEQSDHPS